MLNFKCICMEEKNELIEINTQLKVSMNLRKREIFLNPP
ncbi:hypothetical protein ACI8B_90017 [Acinetobacter proteolyticus]|uniref:Uncharacterized protein n=1 Tax=Acinetobacter proteolyticus TaxID=1776741 RepID=A0A653KBI0_9GAMM|nr:hypothetical protein ACI8B_90017 [Acinetobacter proteolyticus]